MQRKQKGKTGNLLKKHQFYFKKKWGQNFLADKNLLRKIAQAIDVKTGDTVVEVGPGAGTLTRVLAEYGARVLAVEIDPDLIPVLREELADLDVTVLQGDILRLDLDEITKEHDFRRPYKLAANLPYYITTPFLLKMLENGYHIEVAALMLQKEVARRLTAAAGTKDYGAITLAVEYRMEVQMAFEVPRHLFYPAPQVDSAVVIFRQRKAPPVEVKNEAFMFRIIKAAFGQRRKTILNALGSLALAEREELQTWLGSAGIDSQRRGETLTLAEFAQLANAWKD